MLDQSVFQNTEFTLFGLCHLLQCYGGDVGQFGKLLDCNGKVQILGIFQCLGIDADDFAVGVQQRAAELEGLFDCDPKRQSSAFP